MSSRDDLLSLWKLKAGIASGQALIGSDLL